jgi:hypothetical protein
LPITRASLRDPPVRRGPCLLSKDAVSDEVWAEAARHYDERALAALVIAIATINVWNRSNAAVRQAGSAWR